ncbi:MAG: cupin domain-containing protein [Steroidobacteraceae bacterium]
MTAFAKLSELGPLPIWNGVSCRAVEGANVTMAVVELEPKAVVPEHQHPNEQLGVVLQGSVTFTIGGERRDLVAGDTYVIPGNVPHDVVTGPSGAVVVDVFSPVRADWSRFEPGEPCLPQWP